MEEQFDDEGMRRVQWAQRRERMQLEKRRQMRQRKILRVALPIAAVLIIGLVVAGVSRIGSRSAEEQAQDSMAEAAMGNMAENDISWIQSDDGDASDDTGDIQSGGDLDVPAEGDSVQEADVSSALDGAGKDIPAPEHPLGKYNATDETLSPNEDIMSNFVIFVNVDTGNILMRRNATERMNPASMTKVLTLLVAVEHIDNLDDTFTITGDIADYCFIHGCTTAGFEKGDTVTVRDLLYGTILPSGADAALGLATYVAGSEEAFVKMMNDKLDELGLSGSAHFTNCVGLYDENHYCSVYDMAVIMENAISNETCRTVLSAHTYQTSPTQREPEGRLLSNWFLRRIEDKDTGGEVLCGKTGFVNQSGNCAVSYGIDKAGKKYICVTAKCELGGWKCIGDHVRMYKQFSGTA